MEEKQRIQGDLNRRNTETITQKLEEMNQRIYAQDVKIANQDQAISSFVNRIQSLEQQLLLFKVRMTGTGPSSQ